MFRFTQLARNEKIAQYLLFRKCCRKIAARQSAQLNKAPLRQKKLLKKIPQTTYVGVSARYEFKHSDSSKNSIPIEIAQDSNGNPNEMVLITKNEYSLLHSEQETALRWAVKQMSSST